MGRSTMWLAAGVSTVLFHWSRAASRSGFLSWPTPAKPKRRRGGRRDSVSRISAKVLRKSAPGSGVCDPDHLGLSHESMPTISRAILCFMRKRSHVYRYPDAVAGMDEYGQALKGLIKELLGHNDVKFHTIDYRVKTEDSARRKLATPDSGYVGYSSLHDLLGLRITCYFADEVDSVADIIEKEFTVDPNKSVDKGKQLGLREFGYRSVHRVATVNGKRAELAEYDRFKNLRFEVQIRTVVQHAWAEIEHDLGYKQATIPAPMRRRFSMLAGVLELVDFEFTALRDELKEYERDADNAAKTQADMALDLATMASIVKYDKVIASLDEELRKAVGATLEDEDEQDANYFEQRLSDFLSLGVDSMSEVRRCAEAWKPHVLAFAPKWLSANYERRGKQLVVENLRFPQGVSLYYLWLVMGLEARSKGREVDSFLTEPGSAEIWAETVAEVGDAPPLPSPAE